MNELETLLAEAACARLVTAHCHAIDHGDTDAFVEAFTRDGDWDRPDGESLHGHEALRAYFLARPPAVSRHVCSNVVVTVAGPTEALATSLAMLYRAEVPDTRGPVPLESPMGIVEYTDTLVRTDRGWRIRRRHADLVFASAHVPAAGGRR